MVLFLGIKIYLYYWLNILSDHPGSDKMSQIWLKIGAFNSFCHVLISKLFFACYKLLKKKCHKLISAYHMMTNSILLGNISVSY